MDRRDYLGALGTLLPTGMVGCTGFGRSGGSSDDPAGGSGDLAAERPTARLSMAAVDDRDLPPRVLYTVREDLERETELFDRILDGRATTEGTRPPLPEGEHISYGDAVYRLSREIVERTPATRYSVKVDVAQESVALGSATDAGTVRFADLPAVDREKFEAVGLADGDPVGIGTTFLYTDAERERSVLVPDSDYSHVAWANGARAEWVVDDAYDTTLNTYRYTAERVAPAAEYGRRMRERFAFGLSDLPDAQRTVVETAVSEEAYVVGPDATPSPAFVSLADRFRDHEQAHALDETGEGDLSGSYLVRYGGEVYWTTLIARNVAFRTGTSG